MMNRSLRAVSACAIVVTAAACGTVPPPPAPVPPAPGLPAPGALTVAGEAGQVLVGLTLQPARPGPNVVTVYLDPVDGPRAAGALEASVSAGQETHVLRTCGGPCRNASINLQPGDSLAVHVMGPTGGAVSFTFPQLPAPSGQALLTEAQSRMHRLRTYRDHDTLFGGVGPTIVTDSIDEAPDRAEWTTNGEQTIWIGTSQFARTGPEGTWTKTSGLQAAAYPFFVWDPFAPLVDAHVVGQAVIDGSPATAVAFAGTSPGIPVWFEAWIAGGLVLRSTMFAQAHFMHDTYSGFDQPVSIAAPTDFTVATPAAGRAPPGSAQGSGPSPSPT